MPCRFHRLPLAVMISKTRSVIALASARLHRRTRPVGERAHLTPTGRWLVVSADDGTLWMQFVLVPVPRAASSTHRHGAVSHGAGAAASLAVRRASVSSGCGGADSRLAETLSGGAAGRH